MDVCRVCGTTLVWGENACTFSGSVCWNCQPRPWYPPVSQCQRDRLFTLPSVSYADMEGAFLEWQEERDIVDDGGEYFP